MKNRAGQCRTIQGIAWQSTVVLGQCRAMKDRVGKCSLAKGIAGQCSLVKDSAGWRRKRQNKKLLCTLPDNLKGLKSLGQCRMEKKLFKVGRFLIFIIISYQTASFEVQNIHRWQKEIFNACDLQRRPVASYYFIATGVLIGKYQ